jgi:site-specific recombinase XerD
MDRRLGEQLLVAVADGLRGRGRASRTVETRLWHLRRFFAHLLGIGIEDPARVSAEVLEAYRQHLLDRPGRGGAAISVSHVNGALASIKSFFGLLLEWDLIGLDPTRRMSLLKKPRRLPRTVLSIDRGAQDRGGA